MSRRRRAAALLGLALALGALAAAEVRGRERELRQALSPQVPVVVAARALRAGARIPTVALGVRRVPVRYAPDGAFSSPAEVAGRRTAVDVPRGADLATTLVEDEAAAAPSSTLRPGERVGSLVAVGDPATLAAGGRLDVVVTRDDGAGGAGVTQLALQDVEILSAAPAPADDRSGGAGRVALQLRVTVRQAVFLAAAQSFAREVRVLARAPDDRGHVAGGLRVDDGL